MTGRIGRAGAMGWAVVAVAAFVYWLADRTFDAGRGDFFYLADAFLHGRSWLDVQLGPYDQIDIGGRIYVPFAPFPAIALMPVVALIGAVPADQLEPGINAVLAAAGVGMCWWLLGRIGVARLIDRLWLSILFGFSTQIVWVTTRGGVWHTGQLIATLLTFACLLELWGKRRAWLIGLAAGAAFLTRAPLAFAIPIYACVLIAPPWRSADVGAPDRSAGGASDPGGHVPRGRHRWPWRAWILLALGALPSVAFFFFYDQVRFGSPFESGYALASLPPFLEQQRAQGLFSIAHVPMNLDYFLLHLPTINNVFPYIQPDGLGLSVFLTSPGLLFAIRADWRRSSTWWLLAATVVVLIPTLLYYGGGWYQFGYRYFLDSVPFVMAMCGLAAVYRGRVGRGWKVLIVIGCLVMAFGVLWAHV
jgi:hypothetical protein